MMPKAKSTWQKDPLRKLLKKDVLENVISEGMEAIDAMRVCDEYIAMGIRVFMP